MKYGSSILIFLLAFTSASLISELNADFTDDCKALVDSVVLDSIVIFIEKNPVTAAAWDVFKCLEDPKIFDDMKAICTILGRRMPNTTQEYNRAYNQVSQIVAQIDLWDKAKGRSSLSEKDMEAIMNWISAHIPDPKLAQAVKQLGPALMNCSAMPETTSAYLKNQGRRVDEGNTSVVDDFKEAFRNATPCIECNLCNYARSYLETHVLPNPLLPACLATEVKDKFCIWLNDTAPSSDLGLELYSMCINATETLSGTLIEAIKTLIQPNLLCGSVFKVCNGNNTIQCVCDHTRLPHYLDWILPCG